MCEVFLGEREGVLQFGVTVDLLTTAQLRRRPQLPRFVPDEKII